MSGGAPLAPWLPGPFVALRRMVAPAQGVGEAAPRRGVCSAGPAPYQGLQFLYGDGEAPSLSRHSANIFFCLSNMVKHPVYRWRKRIPLPDALKNYLQTPLGVPTFKVMWKEILNSFNVCLTSHGC